MSSLFQGLGDAAGKLAVTTDPAGTVPYRGMYVTPEGAVLVAADTGQARAFHSGRAFDAATGALLVDPGAITPVNGMGGMVVDINGGVISKDQPADVIHQGTGLTVEGYLSMTGSGPSVPTGASFFAPLQSDDTELVAGYTPTATRASDGWYWDGSVYQVAGNDVARFEAPGRLMEPASTNHIRTYNANPDVALTNLSTGGDVNGILRRINDAAQLNSAGLSNICNSGFAVEIDNTAGTTDFIVEFGGGSPTPGIRTVSAFCRKTAGGASNPYITTSHGMISSVPITSSTYVRYSGTGNSTTGNEAMRIIAPAGTIARAVLNQLEELPVPTSPIVTQGASASRAKDSLQYAGSDTFLPDTCTVLLQIEPVDNSIQSVRDSGLAIDNYISMNTSTNNYVINNTNNVNGACSIYGRNASQFIQILFDNVRDGTAERWAYTNNSTSGGHQWYGWHNSTKYKQTGVSSGVLFRNQNSMYVIRDSNYGPIHVKDVIIYPEVKDEAWLDANWLCDGCFPP